MSYIDFDKNQLINLEFSLKRELIRSNRRGSYANLTIVGCNTRKYHGLLITPQPTIDENNHVLLSALDETVIQQNAEFNLGIHKYQGGVYLPKGHKYLRDFTIDVIPKLTYTVGGVVLTKEMLFSQTEDRVLIRYTLVEAHSPTILRFKPFLAYRCVHSLSKSNVYVDTKYQDIANGIKLRMYTGYSHLCTQFSKKVEYVHVPHWYYNIEYFEEKERGYEYLEDLYVPGYFELPIKKGESVVFSAGTEEIDPRLLNKLFESELKKRTPRNGFEYCLQNAAQQFIVKRGKKTEIIAGFPWFGRWGRDTFISLPGLTLSTGDEKTCKEVIDTMVEELNGPLFPNVGEGSNASYNSVDASLWFFWALQQYAEHTQSKHLVWKQYGKKMQMILDGLKQGTLFNIKMQDNGLIYAGEQGRAITWMDAVVCGKPITPRIGMPVEINALWYNAIMFSIEVAKLAKEKHFVDKWQEIVNRIPVSFVNTFWDDRKGYLADYVDGDYKDWAIRPNQVIATSLPFSILDEEKCHSVLDVVEKKLLTPRGLRTLSPQHPDYKGVYYGSQTERDHAYHQGTVWPWLLGHFVEGYLKVNGKTGLALVKSLYKGFEEVMFEHGVGTISEVYDGDPPHKPGGAISQAWSVAELLRINQLIKQFEKKTKSKLK